MALWEWYSAGQNLMYVLLIMKPSAFPPSAPNGAGVNLSLVTRLKKPRSPSKIGAGPVIPSAARVAANTPLRAAFANAQPFHILNSPERVCRNATLQTPARPIVWVIFVTSSFINFAAATADEIAPYVTWSTPCLRRLAASQKRHWIS